MNVCRHERTMMVWVGNEVWENEVMAVYMNDHDEMDMLSHDGMTLVMVNESYG